MSQFNGPSILATRLSSIMMNRVQTNSVLLLVCLTTGAVAYLAFIAAAWFALEQATNAVYASLIVAAGMLVLTFIVWIIKRFRDKRAQARQTITQNQLLATLTHTTVDRALEKNALLAPAVALIGWSLLSKDQDDKTDVKHLPR
jgi:adenylylsulfate kinase-like enzyme